MDDKIYFNITINYNQRKGVRVKTATTVAETTVEIIDPLITNTKDYDLCISKFRVDTLTIPLVIPELLQPQNIEDGKIELNYWASLYKVEYTESGAIYQEVAYKNLYLTPKRFNRSYDPIVPLGAYKAVKPFKRIHPVNSEKAYLDNLDPFCYIYEPQEFVDSMNNALAEAFCELDPNKDPVECTKQAFFTIDGNRLKFYQNSAIDVKIVFSDNLYRYFGCGFNTKRVLDNVGWMIANDADTRTPCIDKDKDKYVNRYADPDNADFSPDNYPYNIAVNHFGITQVWNACKAILICSNTLPIKGEFIPVTENDGLLIHENSATCRRNYEEYHGGSKDSSNLGDPGIFTPTYKVLESFYPVSAEGGDIRTSIIFSNDAMDVSTKHQLLGDCTQLKKFDISVKWLDIYNNIHDLELLEGSSCDIRIAFVKKSVKQDIIYEGIREIIKRLGGSTEVHPPPMQKARIIRTNSSIELPNADKYGFTKI